MEHQTSLPAPRTHLHGCRGLDPKAWPPSCSLLSLTKGMHTTCSAVCANQAADHLAYHLAAHMLLSAGHIDRIAHSTPLHCALPSRSRAPPNQGPHVVRPGAAAPSRPCLAAPGAGARRTEPKHKPLPIFLPCTAAVRLAQDVFVEMDEPRQQAVGFPGAEEASQKIEYDYGNYDDYLHTSVHARPSLNAH